jgi:hypothetical protein
VKQQLVTATMELMLYKEGIKSTPSSTPLQTPPTSAPPSGTPTPEGTLKKNPGKRMTLASANPFRKTSSPEEPEAPISSSPEATSSPDVKFRSWNKRLIYDMQGTLYSSIDYIGLISSRRCWKTVDKRA